MAFETYDASSMRDGKAACKKALQLVISYAPHNISLCSYLGDYGFVCNVAQAFVWPVVYEETSQQGSRKGLVDNWTLSVPTRPVCRDQCDGGHSNIMHLAITGKAAVQQILKSFSIHHVVSLLTAGSNICLHFKVAVHVPGQIGNTQFAFTLQDTLQTSRSPLPWHLQKAYEQPCCWSVATTWKYAALACFRTAMQSMENKRTHLNQMFMLQEMGLPEDPNIPMLGFIGRLDYQKGVDLIRDSYEWMMGEGVQLIMLGSGRGDLEDSLRCSFRKPFAFLR